MGLVLRLVETRADGETSSVDVLELSRPGDLRDISSLGLTLPEAKQILARVQQAVVAAQARDHASLRPKCLHCGDCCHTKDWSSRQVATLFGTVVVRLPRFRCPGCGRGETGVRWATHCRSTPELDQLQAHLSALMTYRVAAGVLAHLLPVAAATSHETLRGCTLALGEQLRSASMIKPEPATAVAVPPALAITLGLDSTFIRSRHEGERNLEVRVGHAETPAGVRQVFGAVAKAGTDVAALIRRALDALGRTSATALTAFTDGCPGLRSILASAGVAGPPILDWFHLSMRLQHAKQVAEALPADTRISSKQRPRSPPRSNACAGGPGTARPGTPGSPSNASARSCPTSNVSPRASCVGRCMRWTATFAVRARFWSTTPNGTAPACGSEHR